MSNLRLSTEHGVNPSVEQCFVCMKDVGVVLFGKLDVPRRRDIKAPRRLCFGPQADPCDECKGHMKLGVILISVDEGKSTNMDNPWRTGGWVVLKEEAIHRIVNPPELADQIISRRMAFLPDEAWDMIGLPREATP